MTTLMSALAALSLFTAVPTVDSTFALDPTAGTVRFGDGAVGRAPAAGDSVTATYAQGAGAAGNVPTDSFSSVDISIFCLEFSC